MHHYSFTSRRFLFDEKRRCYALLFVPLVLGSLGGFFYTEFFPVSCTALSDLLFQAGSFDDKGAFPVCFLQSLLLYYRVPVLALIFSYSPWEKFLLPLLLFVQSFLLSLSLFSFAHCGSGGMLIALVLLGSRYLFLVPVSVFVCSFRHTERLSGRNKKQMHPVQVLLCCIFILLLGATIETVLASRFLPLLLDKFF